MLTQCDIIYMENSIYQAHKEIGTKVSFLIPEEDSKVDIYKEDKFKRYKAPIPLHGLVISNPSEEMSVIGLKENATLIFSFSKTELTNLGILKLRQTDILKCAIQYGDDRYTIVAIVPCNVVMGTNLAFKYECRLI